MHCKHLSALTTRYYSQPFSRLSFYSPTCRILPTTMGSFLPFRRRRREQGAEQRPDEPPSLPSSRTLSVPSPAPTHHIYAYPNPLGYADTASLHSTYSLPWSPISRTPSPAPLTYSHPNKSTPGLWIYESDRSNAREELEAARQRSRLNASQNAIVSYGPNPVTPTPARIPTPSASYLNGSSRPDPQPTPPTSEQIPRTNSRLLWTK